MNNYIIHPLKDVINVKRDTRGLIVYLMIYQILLEFSIEKARVIHEN